MLSFHLFFDMHHKITKFIHILENCQPPITCIYHFSWCDVSNKMASHYTFMWFKFKIVKTSPIIKHPNLYITPLLIIKGFARQTSYCLYANVIGFSSCLVSKYYLTSCTHIYTLNIEQGWIDNLIQYTNKFFRI